MSKLEIITAPDPRLKKVAQEVGRVDAELQKQIDDMFETMYEARGIGLAATQVGILNRVLVLDVDQVDDNEGKGNPMAFINPQIIYSSEEMNVYDEGCLSLPAMYAEVERPKIIRVKYLDSHNNECELEADGLLATCLQHEIDHLNGVLFVDHVSSLRRNMILKKLKKLKKDAKIL